MVKRSILKSFFFVSLIARLSADNINMTTPTNVYENNCIPCHQSLSITLDKIYFRYLLKYSSEISVKSALMDFLKNPNMQTSAMSSEQLRLLGLKSKTNLSDEELKNAINIYWDRNKVFGRLY